MWWAIATDDGACILIGGGEMAWNWEIQGTINQKVNDLFDPKHGPRCC